MIRKTFKPSILILALLMTMQCAVKRADAPDLPNNLLGVKLGMSKQDAENRLREIGRFKEDAAKGQQVWVVEKDPRFNSLAIGYDKENQVRYVTAFAEKGSVKERVRFTDVGDVSKAKKEVTEPHHRYSWEVPASDKNPAYIITIYGTDNEYLTIYSLAEKPRQNKEEEEED